MVSLLQCNAPVYAVSVGKSLSASDVEAVGGFSQAYLQALQPAAVATSYGHFLNADANGCYFATAATSPLQCAPNSTQLGSQNNSISIQVTGDSGLVGGYSETVYQVGLHDQGVDRSLIRDQARIQPIGKM